MVAATSLGVTAAPSLATDDEPWLIRPYDAGLDEDGMMSFLGESYCRCSAGRRAGASGYTEADTEGESKRKDFLAKTRPIWTWLLANADVTLSVDPENPDTSIWAWMISSGPDVLHAVGCKRTVIATGLCRDMVMGLLGPRWNTFQVLTLELPQMRANRVGWKPATNHFGFDRPSRWVIDPSWLAVRMVKP